MEDVEEDRKRLIRTMCELMAMVYEFGQEKGEDKGGDDMRKGIKKLASYVFSYST